MIKVTFPRHPESSEVRAQYQNQWTSCEYLAVFQLHPLEVSVVEDPCVLGYLYLLGLGENSKIYQNSGTAYPKLQRNPKT